MCNISASIFQVSMNRSKDEIVVQKCSISGHWRLEEMHNRETTQIEPKME